MISLEYLILTAVLLASLALLLPVYIEGVNTGISGLKERRVEVLEEKIRIYRDICLLKGFSKTVVDVPEGWREMEAGEYVAVFRGERGCEPELSRRST